MIIALILVAGVLVISAEPSGAQTGQGTLTINKTSSPLVVRPGEELSYSLTLGCSSLTTSCIDAVATDVLPEGLDVTSLPQSTPERDVTYDEGTRQLTIAFKISLFSPPAPPGSVGLPGGSSQTLNVGLRLPSETDLEEGEVVTNSATLSAANATPVSDDASFTVQVPRVVRPVATKTWADGHAVAQSQEPSTVTLGVRNASSTSAEVTELAVTDDTPATFDLFDVTSVGPVTSFPAGADRVVVQACTQPAATPCTPAQYQSSASQAGPALALPAGVSPGQVTSLRFVFSSSTGAVLPYDSTGGQVQFGLVLRDTSRSTGQEINPPTRITVDNCGLPSVVDEVQGQVVGDPACAAYFIAPNIATVSLTKAFIPDSTGDYVADGQAIAGQSSPVSILLTAQNTSPFAVQTMTITEPSASSASNFDLVDVRSIRIDFPAGATSALLRVTCSGGGVLESTYTSNQNLLPTGCPLTQRLTAVEVIFTGTGPGGIPAIAQLATARLGLLANVSPTVTTARTITNCADSHATNPVDGSGSTTATHCRNLTVVAATTTTSGSKSAGSPSIVPGQPLNFTINFRNTGTIPSPGLVMLDPADPTVPNNPFDSVRLVSITVPASPPATVEVYDPAAAAGAGAYVPYVASDAALLERARGLRVSLQGPLASQQLYSMSISVMLRDGVPVGTQLRNCMTVGGTSPCSGFVTVGDPSTGGSVQKQFAPGAVTKPQPGLPGSVVQLRVRVQNNGTLNLNRLVVTDVDPDFFDAVDVVGSPTVNFPPGANRVRVDVCTTGCATGDFVLGALSSSLSPPLPASVPVEDIRGVRYTFTRADGLYLLTPGFNYPIGGNCASASACLQVRPRATLRSTGDPVPDALEDTASGAGESVLQAPGETFAIGDTTATLELGPGEARLSLDKRPDSRIAPGEAAPFAMEIVNTGTGPIPDPVVVDPYPAGLDLDRNFPGGTFDKPFTVTYDIPAGSPPPPDPEVVIVPDPGDPNRVAKMTLSWPGWSLLPGARILVNTQVHLAPGTLPGTVIRNTAGASGARADMTCGPLGPNDGEVVDDPSYGPGLFCTSWAEVTALPGNSFQSQKWIAGDPDLGLINTVSGRHESRGATSCPEFVEGARVFTRYPCVALVEPGQPFDYLIRIVNSGNDPATQIRVIDTLPVLGDTGVILTGEDRGTEWAIRPRMLGEPTLSGSGILSLAYEDVFDVCTSELSNPPVVCPAGSWDTPFSQDVTAFKATLDFGSGLMLQPGATVSLRYQMTTPVDLPNPHQFTAAWNSFAHTEFVDQDDGLHQLPPTEPPKAGIGLVYGSLEVGKEVVDPPEGIDLPPFPFRVRCTSTPVGGDPVVVRDESFDVVPGEPVLLELIPAGAVCEVWETDSHLASSDALGEENAIEVEIEPDLTIGAHSSATVTNTYEHGSFTLSKEVIGDAADLVGDGPFVVVVDCHFPVTGDRIAGFPQEVTLDPGEEMSFDGVPVASQCVAFEIDDGGAYRHEIIVEGAQEVSGRLVVVGAQPAQLPSGFRVVNDFPTGRMQISKTVSGGGSVFGDQPFEFSIECSFEGQDLDPVTATITPPEMDVVVEDLVAGSVCVVNETEDGGADGDPPNPVAIVEILPDDDGGPVVVDADNPFSAGAVQVVKALTGPGAGNAVNTPFTILVTCERPVGDGFDALLSREVVITGAGNRLLEDLLPIGGRCWAEETGKGGANFVAVDHGTRETAALVSMEEPLIVVTVTNSFSRVDPPVPPDPPNPPVPPDDGGGDGGGDGADDGDGASGSGVGRSGTLPSTGAEGIGGWVLVGSACLAAGVALSRRSRARRR